MPKLTKLSIVTTALMLAVSPAAFAQDDTPDMTTKSEAVIIFTAADIDADDTLDRDEFVSFVIMKSDAGDAEYGAIKLSGDYDNHFNMKDYNADGLLTAEELSDPSEDDAADIDAPADEPG